MMFRLAALLTLTEGFLKMPTIYEQAVAVHKATGKPYREVFEALRNNPPKQPAAQPTKPAKQPAAAVKFKATDFYHEVERLMDTRNLSYLDAYKRIRRDFPALFDAMLTAVNS